MRARLVQRPENWPWSRVRAHLTGRDSRFVTVAPALGRVGDFAAFLGETFDEAFTYAALRKAEGIGRPIGSPEWPGDMEARSLPLRPQKRGLKLRKRARGQQDSPASYSISISAGASPLS
ncbi:hypothetical protein [Rhizorhabdus dicambivorans]|uniref:hypothetical protein n=1 Tax=Rhizorhabdus dicambivorans TaxID=1850238 RepID=UPI00082C19E5|nr:hypothetical protein [Rhizorhabdus dicambivorans]ATE66373.1 hypothetical protein CMV14_19840 [Rhizorhabdus dicambivorans]